MAHQKLKYGTLVAACLAIAGTTIYETNRNTIHAIDIIELTEAVAEREVILGMIPETNTISLQMAPTWMQFAALDARIKALIPQYVRQSQIEDWYTGYPDGPGGDTPPKWTVISLFTEYEIGNYTNFTRTPAGATGGSATYGSLPHKIYKTDLKERYWVLQALTYTDGTTAWGSNKIYVSSASWTIENTNASHSFYGSSWSECESTNQMRLINDDRPGWWASLSDYYEAEAPNIPANPTSTPMGNPPLTESYLSLILAEYYLSEGAWINSLMPNWNFYYSMSKKVTASGSSAYTTAQITNEALNVPINRVTTYYHDNDIFEEINVLSNTPPSSTSLYAERPGGFVAAYAFIVAEASVDGGSADTDDYEWDCDGSDFVKGFSRGVSDGPRTNSTSFVDIAVKMPCIHRWAVERAVPED